MKPSFSEGSSSYRGRIAPTPSGYLHIGHARTFLAAQLRSQQQNGVLVFRNEDLDLDRCKLQYVTAMYEDLKWAGLAWQEGPDVGGPFAPYSQSERGDLYRAAWRKLLEMGTIYPCSCSRKDLAQIAQAPQDEDDEPVYPGKCRPTVTRSQTTMKSARGSNWRFRVPDGETITFMDNNGLFGTRSYTCGKDLGDFLVWRRDDVPAYQLAVVVDDAAMQVTEVVRGADLLKSTARQILLQRSLGLPQLEYFHCQLVTDENGVRLAKRNDALSLRTLRLNGHHPEILMTQR